MIADSRSRKLDDKTLAGGWGQIKEKIDGQGVPDLNRQICNVGVEREQENRLDSNDGGASDVAE